MFGCLAIFSRSEVSPLGDLYLCVAAVLVNGVEGERSSASYEEVEKAFKGNG